MVSSLDLSGTWKARGFDGQHGDSWSFITGKPNATFFDAEVPGDIHLDLERLGILADCRQGMNVLAARWVEEQVWLYDRTFDAPPDAFGKNCWLVFEGLDINAAVFLNGEEVGTHNNFFRPCRLNVTGKLREGENRLSVRIESGLFSVAEKPGSAYNQALDHSLHKRSWLRKPQSQFSWDWSPRLVNVGIWRPVRLEWTDSARIEAVTIRSEINEEQTVASVCVRGIIESVREVDVEATLRVRVAQGDLLAEKQITLTSGVSSHEVCVDIVSPQLWWPRPHGSQPLYDFEIEVEIDGAVVDSAIRRTGIRSIKINRDAHPVEGNYFIVEVNGRPIFCKGANWVPADIIYARVTPEHYRKLVDLAAEANFNLLRIWGGGLYADHAMLDRCDELGVLVWHDFIFACSKYPSDDPVFLGDVRAEVQHVVRELCAHPSLIVWCGNNELEWGAWEWGFDREKAFPDYALYHLEIPRIVCREDPSRPYWPSSPYSEGLAHPNITTTGDQHPWEVSLGAHGPNFWAYRSNVSRFPNEGGVLGMVSAATLREGLGEEACKLHSPEWELHDNACNYWGQGGVAYRVFEEWLGRRVEETSCDDYVFYSGIMQSEGLQEYINNFRRRMFSSAAAVFWMYNDCWPATHSWALVDYYLRRKLAYHPVRRAFAPVYVIPVVENDTVSIIGVNDTLSPWQGQARFGFFGLGGGYDVDRTAAVTLGPNARTVIAELPLGRWHQLNEKKTGAFALLLKNGELVAQNRLFVAKHHELEMPEAEVQVRREGPKALFSCQTFAWGVCIDPDGEAEVADDVFDLLPGVDYAIDWPEEAPLPQVKRVASNFPWA